MKRMDMGNVARVVCIGIVAVAMALVALLAYNVSLNKDMERKWKDAVESNKAYDGLLSSSEVDNRAFKVTIDQLECSRDSILNELDRARKELKVKDSRLRSLQYISSSFSRADTITLVDTLLRDPQVSVDTLLSDEWYSVRVGLHYPSVIAVRPEFKSIKEVVVSSRRETVNPPKRFFLFRWFQKRHTVLNIDVVEKNPYVGNQRSRYIEIVR